ncbi:MAG: hypothetical protein K2J32_08165 [Ruminococcus sp.]|nr:hypothetical protein [Ruminococcus sp.]
MAKQELVDKKFPLAISFMILCNTGQKTNLRYNIDKVKRLAKPLYFENENDEAGYADYKNDFSAELFNSHGSDKIMFRENSIFFEDIFTHKEDYYFSSLIKCFHHFFDDAEIPDEILSIDDVKSCYRIMIENRTTLSGKDFDNEYCWKIAQLFLESSSPHNILPTSYHNALDCSAFEFIKNHISKIDEIEKIEIAFHAGFLWTVTPEKFELLSNFIKKDINIYIIINDASLDDIVFKHLRGNNRAYISLENNISLWKETQEKISKKLNIHVTNIPLFHRYCAIHMRNQKNSVIQTSFYTYGNPNIDKNYSEIFNYNSDYFKLFKKEFDYLWNESFDIENYKY